MSFSQVSNKRTLSLDGKARALLQYANEKRKAGLFNDINIQVGNERFPCNKMVLSCYSTYFETMLKTEMQEKYQDTVELQGCEERFIKLLIDYMYGEEVVIDDKNVLSILAAAGYLQIDDVKIFCIEYLNNDLNIENCLNVLNAYNLYMPLVPANHVYQFISSNFGAIYQQEKFKNLATNDLASLLEELNKKKLNQEQLFFAIIGWVSSDREHRKYDFSTLFQLIDLSKLSPQLLEEVISNDALVKQNAECLNSVVMAFSRNIKQFRLDHNYLHKSPSKILSIGGNQKNAVIELHTSSDSKNTVSRYPKLPLKLKGHSAGKVNNFVFCIGGTILRAVARYCTNSVYRMDLTYQNMEWQVVASMKERRSDHGSSFFKGNIVVSGGQRGEEPLNSVESYESISNRWKQIQTMNSSRNGHAMTVCNNRLYALGGVSDKSKQVKLSSVETLSELDGKWETGRPMNTARYRFAAVSLGGEIYAIGGQSKAGIEKSVEKFVPGENKWSYVSQMNSARWGHAACVFGGKIIVVGGRGEEQSTDEVPIMESYDPTNDTWSIVSKDQFEELNGHSLVVV